MMNYELSRKGSIGSIEDELAQIVASEAHIQRAGDCSGSIDVMVESDGYEETVNELAELAEQWGHTVRQTDRSDEFVFIRLEVQGGGGR